MLEIKDLHVNVENKEILKGIDLSVNTGEIHAIMGRNGSGKSTLSNVITGKEGYNIKSGTITFLGQNLLELSIEERALAGIFLSFQYPVALPGVNNTYFLKAALNAKRRSLGMEELDAIDFLALIREKLKLVDMDESYMKRSVNDGFSGGEKKRNEILQMLLLEPKLAILDETDSGLDIDALKIIASGVDNYCNQDSGIIVITHYQRILQYLTPDYVHVLIDGKIVK